MFANMAGPVETYIDFPDEWVWHYQYGAGISISLATILAGWWVCRLRTVQTATARAVLLATAGLLTAAFPALWLASHPHYGLVTRWEIGAWFAVYMPAVWAVACALLFYLGWNRVRGVREQKEASFPETSAGSKLTERTFVGCESIKSARIRENLPTND